MELWPLPPPFLRVRGIRVRPLLNDQVIGQLVAGSRAPWRYPIPQGLCRSLLRPWKKPQIAPLGSSEPFKVTEEEVAIA